MENFEINKYNSLVAYHNDDKRIDEIIVPDGVKYISYAVFREYNINHVILPDSVESIDSSAFHGKALYSTATSCITYRGVTFHTGGYYNCLYTVIKMIHDKDYSCVLDHDLKYPVILQIYFNDGDDVTTAYIKKNFRKFFVFLTDEIDVKNRLGFSMHIKDVFNIIESLVKSGKFITKRNINTYIKLADEKQCYEVFDMLNEYREENNF